MKRGHLYLAAVLVNGALATAIHAQPSTGSTPLSEALKEFADQRHLQLMYLSDLVENYRVEAVSKDAPTAEALHRLLEGTGLTYAFVNERTIRIYAKPMVVPIRTQTVPETANNASTEVASAGTGTANTLLEEITVTAQRRSENLQRVPIAVSAVTAETAAQMGVTSSVDIPVVAPAVTFNSTIGGAAVTIRGVGSSGSAGDESANAVYLDGVYQPSLPALVFSLNNIERIEIMKGPQGTLFGRNASGGVVQVITRDPQHKPAADVSLGYGNFDTIEANVYATAGVTDTLAADIALYNRDQGEGWGTNLFTGHDAYRGDSFAARSKWRWTPGEQTSVTLSGMYSDTRNPTMQGQSLVPGELGPGGTRNVGFWNSNSRDIKYGVIQRAGALTVEHEFDWARFLSITSYEDTDLTQIYDPDATPLNLVNSRAFRGSKGWTQELQLGSVGNGAFTWIGGLYYFRNEQSGDPVLIMPGAGPVSNTTSKMLTDSYAAYAQSSVKIFDPTTLTLGLRYTSDERDFDARTFVGANPVPTVVDDSQEDSKVTWRFAIDQQFNDDVLGYVSYSRGFKSGFFNIIAPTNPPVKPQTVDAYELGIKSELLGRRIRLNASVYYYEFDDIQLRRVEGPVIAFFNAAAAEMKGVDVDVVAAITDNFTITGGIAYLDGEYTDFQNGPFFSESPTGGLIQSPVGADFTGNTTINSPEWVGTLAAQYTLRLPVGNVIGSATYYYNDGYYIFDPQNRIEQPSYDLINANIKWVAPSEDWELVLWGRNLDESKYYTNMLTNQFGDLYNPGDPRTYGINVTWRYR